MTDHSLDNSCCCWTAQPSCQHHQKDVARRDLPCWRWVWVKPTAIQLFWFCWWRTAAIHFAWIRYFTWKILSRACVEHGLTEMVRAACKKDFKYCPQCNPREVNTSSCWCVTRWHWLKNQSEVLNVLQLQVQPGEHAVSWDVLCCAGRFSGRLKACRRNHKWSDKK